MKTTWTAFLLVVAFVLGAPGRTQAQANDEKKTIIFASGLYDAQPPSFTDPRTLTHYIEEGSYTGEWAREESVAVQFGVVHNLFSNFSVGAAFHNVGGTATESFTAEVAHPFYFNRHRSLSGERTDLSYKEQALHILVGFTKMSGPVVVSVTGGPSYLLTKTEIIDDFTFSQDYPYDSISLVSTETKTYEANELGFNVGALVGVRLHENIAVGGDLRFSRAKAAFTTDFGNEIEFDAGGLWVGAGVQILF
jgi:hypothetical protein